MCIATPLNNGDQQVKESIHKCATKWIKDIDYPLCCERMKLPYLKLLNSGWTNIQLILPEKEEAQWSYTKKNKCQVEKQPLLKIWSECRIPLQKKVHVSNVDAFKKSADPDWYIKPLQTVYNAPAHLIIDLMFRGFPWWFDVAL